MPAPQIVPLPPGITLAAGYTLRLTAVDPQTNATVAGVVISGASIDVDPVVDTSPVIPPSPVSGAYTSGSMAA